MDLATACAQIAYVQQKQAQAPASGLQNLRGRGTLSWTQRSVCLLPCLVLVRLDLCFIIQVSPLLWRRAHPSKKTKTDRVVLKRVADHPKADEDTTVSGRSHLLLLLRAVLLIVRRGGFQRRRRAFA